MMKYLLFLLVLPAAQAMAQTGEINPRYDFADTIIQHNGRAFGYQSKNFMDLSVAGFYKETRLYEDSMQGTAPPLRTTLRNKMLWDARSFILREAAKYRIVLINEAHNRAEHRLFTKSLLPGLKAIGYNVLMAEGIWPNNAIDQRKYPISTEGAYLNEPAYASMLRYAKHTGYTIASYEYATDKKGWDDTIKLDKYGSIKYLNYQPRDSMVLIFDENGLKNTMMTSVREQEQARNIVKVIKAHPHAKFIIHVGYGHLYEDGPMMGAKLRALLQGEQVLTIDQTMVTDRVPVIDTVSNTRIMKPYNFIMQDTVGNTSAYPGIPVDYLIFNKPVHDPLGRPDYMYEDVEPRQQYTIPASQRNDLPCMFTAYYEDELKKEKEKAIAVDVVYMPDSTSDKPLLLYKGRYTIVRKDSKGKITQYAVRIK